MDECSYCSAVRRLQALTNHLHPRRETVVDAEVTANAREGLLKGKVAIITGSGQGIGAATAKLFAREGAKVVVTDLDETKSHAIAKEITESGGEALSVPGDVTAPEFPAKLLKATIDKFGELHILVNNAGYTWDGVIHRITDEQWEAMLRVHNTAPFRLIRAAAEYMREPAKREIETRGTAQQRVIINISSTSGLHGNAGQANYATAKMGVVGLSKTVAKEWGQFNIRCNTVAFGWIDTRLTRAREAGAFIEVGGKKVQLGIPAAADEARRARGIPLERPGKPEEAAGAILLMACDYASYITGHTLECTGGMGI